MRPRPGRPVWLFDLDNTLHHASYAIFPRINIAMTDFIVRELGLPREEADRLRTAYTRRYGTVLVGLMRRHGIDAGAFLDEVHHFETLAGLVRTERGLAQTLRRLPGRKILFTNAPETYARAVLDMLGLDRAFERVIAVEQMRDRRRAGNPSRPRHAAADAARAAHPPSRCRARRGHTVPPQALPAHGAQDGLGWSATCGPHRPPAMRPTRRAVTLGAGAKAEGHTISTDVFVR